MKLKPAIIAATLPTIAILVIVLSDSARRDEPVRPNYAQSADQNEIPAWAREPLTEIPAPDSGARWGDSAGSELAGSREARAAIRSALEKTLREDFKRQLGMQYQNEPDELLPALPGVSGFDVAICPRSRNCLNQRLLEEFDNPTWARPMEARIYAELGQYASDGLAQSHVVCRETVCGILFPTSPGSTRIDLRDVGGLLRQNLDFGLYYIAVDRPNLQALYVTSKQPY